MADLEPNAQAEKAIADVRTLANMQPGDPAVQTTMASIIAAIKMAASTAEAAAAAFGISSTWVEVIKAGSTAAIAAVLLYFAVVNVFPHNPPPTPAGPPDVTVNVPVVKTKQTTYYLFKDTDPKLLKGLPNGIVETVGVGAWYSFNGAKVDMPCVVTKEGGIDVDVKVLK